jgi:hypothetical protein
MNYFKLWTITFKVIQGTIQKDLKKVTEEVKKVEKDLRAERIKLIRDKVAESGGDVGGLTDAGKIMDILFISSLFYW